MFNYMQRQSEISEILNIKDIRGITVKDMSGPMFCRFCLSQLDGMPAYDREVMNLSKFLNTWREPTMSDELKIHTIQRLKSLNVL